jgi:hypothetical protein
MNKVSARYLRDVIAESISSTMELRRASLSYDEEGDYEYIKNEPTDEEIDDFIVSNQLFDIELIEQLIDPGLLGFESNYATVTKEWFEEFTENIDGWKTTSNWLGGR